MRVDHRWLLTVVAALGLAALVGIVVLWPPALPEPPAAEGQQTQLVAATLLTVETLEIDDVGLVPGATVVEVIAQLEDSGERVTFEMVDDTGDTFSAGQRVRLQAITAAEGQTTYLVSDFRRTGPLVVLAALFLAAVVGFGRLQGARSLLGLAATFGLIVAFIIPAILAGSNPVIVTLVGATAIMITTLYLSHGVTRKTTAAVVGTACALVLTGALAALFVSAAQLTGFTSEEARLANVEVGGLSLQGLLLAGIILGGLGVLDDVTMAQSSTVFELHRANPAARFGQLLRGALSVGRDHIAATVNTLFLAYAGAALPLLLLFVGGSDSLGTVVTSEIVAVEIVRTLVGSIGLIAAVPMTTALAASLVLGESKGHVDPRSEEPADHPEPENPDDEDAAWVRELRGAYRLPPKQPPPRTGES